MRKRIKHTGTFIVTIVKEPYRVIRVTKQRNLTGLREKRSS